MICIAAAYLALGRETRSNGFQSISIFCSGHAENSIGRLYRTLMFCNCPKISVPSPSIWLCNSFSKSSRTKSFTEALVNSSVLLLNSMCVRSHTPSSGTSRYKSVDPVAQRMLSLRMWHSSLNVTLASCLYEKFFNSILWTGSPRCKILAILISITNVNATGIKYQLKVDSLDSPKLDNTGKVYKKHFPHDRCEFAWIAHIILIVDPLSFYVTPNVGFLATAHVPRCIHFELNSWKITETRKREILSINGMKCIFMKPAENNVSILNIKTVTDRTDG